MLNCGVCASSVDSMLIQGIVDGVPASVSLTDRALTVGRGDSFVAAWDPAGRLYSVVDGERTYRRGLNGRVLTKWREHGERRHAWASRAEADSVVDRAAGVAGGLPRTIALSEGMRAALSRAATFDSAAANSDARRFDEVYRPIGILPPDQYLALVLQATEGCSFRSCTFCDFYGQEYRVKNRSQFAEHVARVQDYLGESTRLRGRTVFIGSANALAVPMPALLPLFDLVAERFPGRPVYAFLDGFTGLLKTEGDYGELAARGLRRVYIGLESGHDPLLALVGKPSTRQQVVETVRRIKAAGLHVGVMVMVGLGGERFADAHVADTAAALKEMPLGSGDLLYFSELVDLPDSPYLTAAAKEGIRALTAAERSAQRHAIESRLAFASSRPKVATYDVREFVY